MEESQATARPQVARTALVMLFVAALALWRGLYELPVRQLGVSLLFGIAFALVITSANQGLRKREASPLMRVAVRVALAFLFALAVMAYAIMSSSGS